MSRNRFKIFSSLERVTRIVFYVTFAIVAVLCCGLSIYVVLDEDNFISSVTNLFMYVFIGVNILMYLSFFCFILCERINWKSAQYPNSNKEYKETESLITTIKNLFKKQKNINSNDSVQKNGYAFAKILFDTMQPLMFFPVFPQTYTYSTLKSFISVYLENLNYILKGYIVFDLSASVNENLIKLKDNINDIENVIYIWSKIMSPMKFDGVPTTKQLQELDDKLGIKYLVDGYFDGISLDDLIA